MLFSGTTPRTQLSGYMIAELCVELVDALSLFLPQILVNAQQAAQGLDVEVQTVEVDVLSSGLEADSGLNSVGLAECTLHDPLQDTHVVAEAGPNELAFFVGAEPVDVEDLGGLVAQLRAHGQPVAEVIAHVVAGEGTHGHRVTTDNAHSAGGGSGGLGGHGGTDIHAVVPVKALVHQRSGLGAAAAEDDSADGHTVGVVELLAQAGAVGGRSGEAGVGMSQLVALGNVLGAVDGDTGPLGGVDGRVLVQTLPPDLAGVVIHSNVGEDGVLLGRVCLCGAVFLRCVFDLQKTFVETAFWNNADRCRFVLWRIKCLQYHAGRRAAKCRFLPGSEYFYNYSVNVVGDSVVSGADDGTECGRLAAGNPGDRAF